MLGHGEVQFESAPRKPGQYGLPVVELEDCGRPVIPQVPCAHFRTDDPLSLQCQSKLFAGVGSAVAAGHKKSRCGAKHHSGFGYFVFRSKTCRLEALSGLP